MASDAGLNHWTFHDHRLPLATPYVWAKGTQTERHIGLVQHAQTGWGEMAPPPHEEWDSTSARELLLACPDDLAALDGLPARLRCGASTAWMDTQAQHAGLSLSAWLAQRYGRTASAEVAANMLLTSPHPERLRLEAAAAIASGYTTLKLKVGSDNDLARVAAVRAGAPHAALRLDANGAWEPEDAMETLSALASYDIQYVEQPVAPEHVSTLHRLTGGPIPIALDESATDPATIARLREAGTGDHFILKPQRLGGLDRTIEAMDAAQDVPVTITNSLESAIGVTATLHVASLLPPGTACGLATSRYLARDIATPPAIVDGMIQVPATPGLGVRPKEAVP